MMDMIDRETAKTLNLNTPTKNKDIELCGEMMRDVSGVFFDGVSLKLLHKLKQKYTSNKFVMSELIEELTNIINAKSGLEKEIVGLEKEVESLRKRNDELENGMDDMNSNFDEIIEYEVSKRCVNEYGLDEESEIEILKNDIECLEREKKELEKKVEDWERMMNLKTERMRDISEEDWVNGRY